jgi:hypothetical protein
MSMHNFSCSDGFGADYIKNTSGHVTPNLFFYLPVGYVGHVVHFGPSGLRNDNTQFSMHGSDRCGFHKNYVSTR